MCMKMADADWSAALEVFRGSLPRPVDKGRDYGLFLEALRNFAVHIPVASRTGTSLR